MTQFFQVKDYCISYKCETTIIDEENETQKWDWEVIAVACVCFEKELWDEAKAELKKYDKMFDSKKDLPHLASSKTSKSKELQNFKRFLYVFWTVTLAISYQNSFH